MSIPLLTLAITDLDRLTHALLLANAAYTADAVAKAEGERWEEAKRNMTALQELYTQLEQALVAETVEEY